MKAELLQILRNHFPNASESTLDDLAEDLQAVTIRALVTPNAGDPAVLELENRVEDIYVDEFGRQLTNLLTMVDFPGKTKVYWSARKSIVRSMIQTMLLEQDAAYHRMTDRGEAIKMRLSELTDTPVLVH